MSVGVAISIISAAIALVACIIAWAEHRDKVRQRDHKAELKQVESNTEQRIKLEEHGKSINVLFDRTRDTEDKLSSAASTIDKMVALLKNHVEDPHVHTQSTP